jgi:dTDP-3,4-didehydro-2,6-dideoxy-alpha-D-glucose 3-reductase
MNSYGISVWGLGNHALKRVIPAILAVKEITLAGVCSRSIKVVRTCAEELACEGWTDPSYMLASEKIHIVYISTPIGIHYNLATLALDSKKHVWCEKPLTCNFNHTKKLINLAKKNEKMLAEGFMFLHHPQFKKIQNLVKSEELGNIHSVVCRFGIPALDEPGFRENVDLCGGAFWDVGSYTVAAAIALFNDQDVKVLFSEIIKLDDLSVDTMGRAILKFSQGTIAYLEWGVGVAYKNEIDLWAENGSFYTDKLFSKPENYFPIYRVRDKYGEETILNGEKAEQFEEMFRVFSEISNSPAKIEEEYKRIYKRAKVMDEIVKLSQ